MITHKKRENLFLVDLNQKMEGFRQFISSWIFIVNDKVIVVDPGPSSTIFVLIEEIKRLGITRVDYILLTHIHIDHAGGTGIICSHFPEAKVICYKNAISHMINPEKLWLVSKAILGKIADIYGPIAPVPQDKIFYPDKIKEGALKIEIIETPGHAAHHVNYLVDGVLFAGEVTGVTIPHDKNLYLRIATPPKFIYSVYKKSLLKAAGLDCDIICFGHYDLRMDVSNVFNHAVEQLELWMETATRHFEHQNLEIENEIFNELITSDSSMKIFRALPADIQKREKYFVLNSIKGMLDFLEHQK